MLGTGSRSPLELSQLDEERLAGRLREAVLRARRSGAETLAAISLAVSDDVDPTAVACASRRPDEHWFAFEQPDRGRAALAGLGEAVRIEAAGGERFQSVAERWRALSASAVGDPGDASDGGGPVAVGGFAFAPDGGAAPHWQGFAPASLVVPQVALRRSERAGAGGNMG